MNSPILYNSRPEHTWEKMIPVPEITLILNVASDRLLFPITLVSIFIVNKGFCMKTKLHNIFRTDNATGTFNSVLVLRPINSKILNKIAQPILKLQANEYIFFVFPVRQLQK